MENKIDCPLCGSTEKIQSTRASGELPTLIDYGFVRALASIVITYDTCQSCGLEYQSPRMTEEEIKKYYEEGHYRKHVMASPEEQEQDEEDRAIRVSESIFKFYSAMKMKTHTINHIDFGSSKGFLLDAITTEWDTATYAVEAEDALPDRKFDLVTAVHVLEHVLDPVAFMKTLVYHMSETSVLYLEVPTKGARGGVHRLAHTLVFTDNTLIRLFTMVGLRIEEIEINNGNLKVFAIKGEQ